MTVSWDDEIPNTWKNMEKLPNQPDTVIPQIIQSRIYCLNVSPNFYPVRGCEKGGRVAIYLPLRNASSTPFCAKANAALITDWERRSNCVDRAWFHDGFIPIATPKKHGLDQGFNIRIT